MLPIEKKAMQRAIEIAGFGLYTTTPNPRVGAVIIQNHQIVAEGFHKFAGEPHGEINAIVNSKTKGISLKNATMVVNLEPCCHFGKTPPCTHAIIKEGFYKVIYANQDPNKKVSGRGVEELKKNGIKVEIADDYFQNEAFKLNQGYFKRHQRSRPWVNLKLALFANGATNLPKTINNGKISNSQSRQDIQYWRARSCAIISGINTIIADNPKLDVRSPPKLFKDQKITNYRQPLKIVLDSNNRLLAQYQKNNLKLFNRGKVLHICCTQYSPTIHKNNYQIKILPKKKNQVDLTKVLQELANLNCNEVMIEAGAVLSRAFLDQDLVDQLTLYYPPKIHPQANNIINELAKENIINNPNWQVVGEKKIVDDFKIILTKRFYDY